MARQISNLEKDALDLIKNTRGGLLQSDLWKKLGLDSREGSRLVLRLTKRGIIRREQVSVNGRRTYKLFLIEDSRPTAKLEVNVGSILDLPCITCPYIDQCGPGNFYDPATCPLMENWVYHRALELTRG